MTNLIWIPTAENISWLLQTDLIKKHSGLVQIIMTTGVYTDVQKAYEGVPVA